MAKAANKNYASTQQQRQQHQQYLLRLLARGRETVTAVRRRPHGRTQQTNNRRRCRLLWSLLCHQPIRVWGSALSRLRMRNGPFRADDILVAPWFSATIAAVMKPAVSGYKARWTATLWRHRDRTQWQQRDDCVVACPHCGAAVTNANEQV